jgi:trk system potassium uptake protein
MKKNLIGRQGGIRPAPFGHQRLSGGRFVDIRPIAFVLGRVLVLLALMMLVPAFLDMRDAVPDGQSFVQSAIVTGFVGLLLSLSTSNALGRGLDVRQAYLLTFAIWVIVPVFAALPFIFGPPGLSLTDAYFESVSGITSTGASVISGLDELPPGINLWRGILNWLGGLGIAVVAMIFLPMMRVGGMQFFRAESFDTFGKVLPRAADIAGQLVVIYVVMSIAAILAYRALGMTNFDATVFGLTSISTGGFAPTDLSFAKYSGGAEYVATVIMILGCLPFVRYIQLASGHPGPLWRDPQVRAFLIWLGIAVLLVTGWRFNATGDGLETAFRQSLFNITSVMTGTGYSTGEFLNWEGFSLAVVFVVGLIGGCSGSSSGAISVFRVQLTARAVIHQIQLIQSPHRVAPILYDGRPVETDVIDALMLFITGFILTLGVLSVAVTLTGVDALSALFAIWTTIGNVGFTYGPLTAETGTYAAFPEAAKWLMILAMILGRLGLLTLLVLALPRFWVR